MLDGGHDVGSILPRGNRLVNGENPIFIDAAIVLKIKDIRLFRYLDGVADGQLARAGRDDGEAAPRSGRCRVVQVKAVRATVELDGVGTSRAHEPARARAETIRSGKVRAVGDDFDLHQLPVGICVSCGAIGLEDQIGGLVVEVEGVFSRGLVFPGHGRAAVARRAEVVGVAPRRLRLPSLDLHSQVPLVDRLHCRAVADVHHRTFLCRQRHAAELELGSDAPVQERALRGLFVAGTVGVHIDLVAFRPVEVAAGVHRGAVAPVDGGVVGGRPRREDGAVGGLGARPAALGRVVDVDVLAAAGERRGGQHRHQQVGKRGEKCAHGLHGVHGVHVF